MNDLIYFSYDIYYRVILMNAPIPFVEPIMKKKDIGEPTNYMEKYNYEKHGEYYQLPVIILDYANEF